MKFDKNTVDMLSEKIALSETDDKKERLSGELSYYTDTVGRISDDREKSNLKNANAVDYSLLREDIPNPFADCEKLFGSDTDRLCVPKIMSGN